MAPSSVAYGVRLILRGWRRSPLVPIASVALLCFLNWSLITAVRVLNGVTLPIDRSSRPDRLVVVQIRSKTSGRMRGISELLLDEIRGGTTTLETVAPIIVDPSTLTLNVGTPSGHRFLTCGIGSSPFFEMFQTKPLVGRVLTAADDGRAAVPVAILSREAWHRFFASDAAVVGSQLKVNGLPYSVIGVLRDEAVQPDVMIWVNRIDNVEEALNYQDSFHLRLRFTVFGALRDGHPLASAQRELESIYDGVKIPTRESQNSSVEVMRVRDFLLSDVQRVLRGLVYLMGALLALGGASMSLLLSLHAYSRRSDSAVRVAVGAPRSAFYIEALMEAILLAGGAGGAALWLSGMIAPPSLGVIDPRLSGIPFGPVFGIQRLALAAMNLVAFLLIAISCFSGGAASGDQAVLIMRGTTAERGWSRLTGRYAVVALQAGIAAGVLVFCSLLVRVLWRAYGAELGFNPEHLVVAQVSLSGSKYKSDESVRRYARELAASAAASPRAQGVSIASFFPVMDNTAISYLGRPGLAVEQVARPENAVEQIDVDASYFRVMGVALIAGSDFGAQSEAERGRSVVVDEDAARRFADSPTDLIGRSVQMVATKYTVIGVTRGVRFHGDPERKLPQTYLYIGNQRRVLPWLTVAVRSALPVTEAAADLERRIRAADPEAPPIRVGAATAFLDEASLRQRRLLGVCTLFAVVSLLVSLLSSSVLAAQIMHTRRVEYGIKLALGLPGSALVRDVCGGLLACTLAGSCGGAWLAGRAATSVPEYFYSSETNWAFLGAAVSLVLIGGALGGVMPVLRFWHTPPAQLLRAP